MSGIRTGTRLERLVSLHQRTRHELASARRREARREIEALARLEKKLYAAIADESPKPSRREPVLDRMAELGVDARTVRTWARAEGLTKADRGRLSAALVEAWAAAHPTDSPSPIGDLT